MVVMYTSNSMSSRRFGCPISLDFFPTLFVGSVRVRDGGIGYGMCICV